MAVVAKSERDRIIVKSRILRVVFIELRLAGIDRAVKGG